jgi:hypothetical protein
MKFQQKEYTALSELIHSSELDYESFEFSKKRGILSIKFQKKQTFRFHRKETTKLDLEKQWTKHVEFRVWVSDEELILDTWADLEQRFIQWLLILKSAT